MNEKIKQIIILRKDLKMRKGKMVAQGAHASMKVFLDLEHCKVISSPKPVDRELRIRFLTKEMVEWINGSFTKICVYVKTEKELLNAYYKAKELDLPCSIVCDSGKTEFGGVPTNTAVAIGPAKSVEIDKITKNMKLL